MCYVTWDNLLFLASFYDNRGISISCKQYVITNCKINTQALTNFDTVLITYASDGLSVAAGPWQVLHVSSVPLCTWCDSSFATHNHIEQQTGIKPSITVQYFIWKLTAAKI